MVSRYLCIIIYHLMPKRFPKVKDILSYPRIGLSILECNPYSTQLPCTISWHYYCGLFTTHAGAILQAALTACSIICAGFCKGHMWPPQCKLFKQVWSKFNLSYRWPIWDLSGVASLTPSTLILRSFAMSQQWQMQPLAIQQTTTNSSILVHHVNTRYAGVPPQYWYLTFTLCW